VYFERIYVDDELLESSSKRRRRGYRNRYDESETRSKRTVSFFHCRRATNTSQLRRAYQGIFSSSLECSDPDLEYSQGQSEDP